MSEDGHHGKDYYVKIWALLLVLLVISIVGPMFEIRVVTLLTAFGIAVVKAYIVASKFMHLDIEKRYISYMLGTCLIFMFLFFTATAPDIMKNSGDNWVKPSFDEKFVQLSPGAAAAKSGKGGHGDSDGGGHH